MKKSEEESTQNGVGIFYTFWQYAPTDDDSRTIPPADIPTNHSKKIPQPSLPSYDRLIELTYCKFFRQGQ